MRSIVLVSGSPGAGKSTIAAPLADALGFPLIAKDVIKESLHDSLGDLDPDPLTSSRRLGAAAMELLWKLAENCSAAVLEANFRPQSTYERGRLMKLDADVVEVFCRCDLSEAARRYALRGKQRHAVHVLASLSAEDLTEFANPLGMGALVEVDTGVPVDMFHLVDRVRGALDGVRT